jgi:hypothetical protein
MAAGQGLRGVYTSAPQPIPHQPVPIYPAGFLYPLRTLLIEDKDLVVWYLKSHRGPEPSDQLYTPFEDIGRWNEEQPDIAIRKYSPVQQMEHKYNAMLKV